MPQTKVMTSYVSLFSGAGGLDIGLEQAGWECLFATDNDLAAVETLEANRGYCFGLKRRVLDRTHIEQADVRALTGRHILERIGVQRGSVPLVAGGPPCQSWSSGGLQRGFEDPRGLLITDYVRVAGELDARWLIFENVRGLLTARGPDGRPGSALSHIRDTLLRHGWQTNIELLNAADFGVPQRRVRLILVGFRSGDAPLLPEPTHAEIPRSGILPWVTLGQCLSSIHPLEPDELIRPTGKMAAELDGIPEGSGAKSPGKLESTRPGGHWGYKQGAFIADPGVPARTVTASAQQDWVRDRAHGLRRLVPRECAAIQSFPEYWTFKGRRLDQYRLIGNAVPPLLAYRLGVALRRHIKLSDVRVDADLTIPLPLPPRLQAAIRYTAREELANGASRRAVRKRLSHGAFATMDV